MGSKEVNGVNGDLFVILPGILGQFRGYIREALDLGINEMG